MSDGWEWTGGGGRWRCGAADLSPACRAVSLIISFTSFEELNGAVSLNGPGQLFFIAGRCVGPISRRTSRAHNEETQHQPQPTTDMPPRSLWFAGGVLTLTGVAFNFFQVRTTTTTQLAPAITACEAPPPLSTRGGLCRLWYTSPLFLLAIHIRILCPYWFVDYLGSLSIGLNVLVRSRSSSPGPATS